MMNELYNENSDFKNIIRILSSKVDTLIGVQNTWHKEHDKRSDEVLSDLKESINRAFGALEELQKQIAKIPCGERKAEINALEKLTNEKIKSIHKNIKWIWIGFSGSLTVITGILTISKIIH